MIAFDPNDPFPFYQKQLPPYAELKLHSEQVDKWLGLDLVKTESQIRAQIQLPGSMLSKRDPTRIPVETWSHLSPQSHQTPYIELRQMLEFCRFLNPYQIVDLGAGYGRMGHVVGRHFLGSHFLGLELCEQRVAEGTRALSAQNYSNVVLCQADLTEAELPPAGLYFMYDFGSIPAIELILDRLKKMALERAIAVVGRGRATRDRIERSQPWLSQVIAPLHYQTYSIYRSR